MRCRVEGNNLQNLVLHITFHPKQPQNVPQSDITTFGACGLRESVHGNLWLNRTLPLIYISNISSFYIAEPFKYLV